MFEVKRFAIIPKFKGASKAVWSTSAVSYVIGFHSSMFSSPVFSLLTFDSYYQQDVYSISFQVLEKIFKSSRIKMASHTLDWQYIASVMAIPQMDRDDGKINLPCFIHCSLKCSRSPSINLYTLVLILTVLSLHVFLSRTFIPLPTKHPNVGYLEEPISSTFTAH